MPSGTPLNRHWVVILRDGIPVYDWGDGLAQDLYTGDFLNFDGVVDYSHGITDAELDQLVRVGRVNTYDSQTVYVYSLPEPPRQTID